KHLYGKAKVLAPSYLYSTDNNITVGSAYLHVLYYKYLRKVKDPRSRIYCTIAAYNTGASNVARAFIKKQHFNQAVNHINKLSSDEVYQALLKRLPFKETRNYVKKVTKNMSKYL
ncbi:MAG TPA: transglycosylase, partial [Gammaproteobacteria bacterium]|nr:transglycosylase [Gammaproteobacteria bacterium]